jgi:hypothetical protein
MAAPPEDALCRALAEQQATVDVQAEDMLMLKAGGAVFKAQLNVAVDALMVEGGAATRRLHQGIAREEIQAMINTLESKLKRSMTHGSCTVNGVPDDSGGDGRGLKKGDGVGSGRGASIGSSCGERRQEGGIAWIWIRLEMTDNLFYVCYLNGPNGYAIWVSLLETPNGYAIWVSPL